VLPEDGTIEAALNAVRDDTSSVGWCVIGYSDKNTLTVIGQGEAGGGLDAVKEHLLDERESFALIRYSHKVDRSTTVMFAYVDWTPDELAPMRKALLSTHKGQLREIFSPHHVDLICATKADLDESEIIRKIGIASGSLDMSVKDKERLKMLKPKNVVENSGEEKKSSSEGTPAVGEASASPATGRNKRSPTKLSDVPKTASVSFVNDDEFKNALAEVHNSQAENTWILCSFDSKMKIQVLGTGSGGVSNMLEKCEPENVSFGLLRMSEIVDRSTTYKFVYIVVQPDDVKSMRKARIGTSLGAAQDCFRPIHSDFFISSPTEITDEMIADKVGAASGSKSFVKKM